MSLSAPKQTTFIVSVVIFLVGLIGAIVSIPVISGFALWLVVIAFVLLALANLAKGL